MTDPTSPKSTGWFESRLRLGSLFRALFQVRVARSYRVSYLFLSAILLLFVFEAISGFFIALWYAPTAEAANASVRHLMEQTFWGTWLRSLHLQGANILVGLLFLHGLQVLVQRHYRAPREINWILGVVLLSLVFGFTITGYLLPWDQNAYWGTQVRVSIMGRAPVVGGLVRELVQGGPEIGNLTLTRFFGFHTLLLPILTFFVLGLHLFSLRKNDECLEEAKTIPYWPRQAFWNVLAGMLVLAVLVALSVRFPAELGDRADSMVTYPARPEWFFRWLFQSLKYFHGPLEVFGAVALVPLLALVLVLFPFIDRDKGGKLGGRKAVLGLGVGLALTLTGISAFSYYSDFQHGHYQEIAIWEAEADPDFEVDSYYHKECRECHGRDGSGYLESTPDFTDPTYWASVRTDFRLVNAILKGVPNETIPEDEVMPAFQDRLTPEQAKAIVVRKIRPFFDDEE